MAIWRRLASKLHLYFGLTAGLLLLPIGLSGSILVFRHEIDAALYPDLLHVEPAGRRVSVDTVVALVREAYPEPGIARLELPRSADEPFEAILRDGRAVYVDPYRATVLGSHRAGETPTGWLFELHVALLAGERGKTVVGLVGLAWLLLGLTGVWLWWRGRANLRSGLVIRWRARPKLFNFDLHRVSGFYMLVPMLLLAFTGAGLIFFDLFSSAAHSLTGTPDPPPPPRASAARGLSVPLDSVVARAQRVLPAARPARIDFPATPEAVCRVRLRMPGEMHPIGMSMVFVDPYNGRVLHAENALEVPAARKLGYLYYPLHIGSFGGTFVQVLYVVFGLVPCLLAVTGALFWWGRRKKGRKKNKRPPRAQRAELPKNS